MGERPRPLPRRRRPGPPELAPAWQQLETERPPTGSLPLAPVLPRRSYGGLSESEFRNEAYRGTGRELMANEINRPPEMYRGERVLGPFLELTGAPSLVRSYARARDGDPLGAAGEAAMGALAIGGVRGAMREPIPAARPAPPMATPWPDDMFGAQPGEFDMNTIFYRGSTRPEISLEARSGGDKPMGDGIHLSRYPEVANEYASMSAEGGANVAQYYARGPFATVEQWRSVLDRMPTFDGRIVRDLDEQRQLVRAARMAAVRELQARGYRGVYGRIYGPGNDGELVVWDPNDLRPRFGALPLEPLPRPPSPEPRLPGRASDGSILPVAPSRPFTNSLRGGGDDLRDAANLQRFLRGDQIQ